MISISGADEGDGPCADDTSDVRCMPLLGTVVLMVEVVLLQWLGTCTACAAEADTPSDACTAADAGADGGAGACADDTSDVRCMLLARVNTNALLRLLLWAARVNTSGLLCLLLSVRVRVRLLGCLSSSQSEVAEDSFQAIDKIRCSAFILPGAEYLR